MFIQTHWKMGQALMNSIPGKIVPLQMNELAFLYGCIAPDILPGMPDHTFEKSNRFIDSLIDEVKQNDIMSLDEAKRRGLFIKMGIISHYVSDYFCQPHNNDPRYKKLLPHILYENRLHFKMNSSNLTQLGLIGLEKFNYFLNPQKFSLMEYIRERRLAYLAEKPDMGKDIQFSAQTSTNIIAALLNHCQMASNQLAA